MTADPWGTPYRYVVNEDRTVGRFISAGADRTFDESSWTIPGELESLGDDAVLKLTKDGGKFVRAWK